MNDRDEMNIERIADEVRFIEDLTSKISRDTFLGDSVLQHALCMSLITIGECANHLSDKFKAKHNNINWIQIIAVRHISAHGYWQLDMQHIWQALEEDIPVLSEFVNGLE